MAPRPKALRSKQILNRRAEPVPSVIFPVFWRFAHERHTIYFRRVAGYPPPWTRDGIFNAYKFTNVYRASDRVSQFFIQMMYAGDTPDAETVFLRTLLFKIFNKIETWKCIAQTLGLPEARTFDFDQCDTLLSNLARGKNTIYSAAYIMPSGGATGPKHRMHLSLLKLMLKERVPARLAAAASLSEVYEILLSYPSLGPFLAFQYAIDINYTELINHSEMDFVVAGPGAIDGLSKCFRHLGDYSPEDAIRWVCERQDAEFRNLDLHFPGLWGRPLQLIDIQNIFCEISKYTRVSHPDVLGVSGRTRIKQKFSATGELPKPYFPPKWEINDSVRTWLVERSRHPHTSNRVGLTTQGDLFAAVKDV